MLNKNTITKKNKQYLSQKELAVRWDCSQSTIKSIRDKGKLPFFSPPNSSRILYPIVQIELIEDENTQNHTRRKSSTKKLTEIKRENPVTSTNSNKKWEI